MKPTIPALALVGALFLVGCTDGSTSGTTAGSTAGTTTEAAASGELTKVTIGTLPIVPTAVIHMGIEQGIFADNGLEVTLETGQGGAALLPAVMTGSMQFATGNPVSLLTARERGLDVRVVASYTYDTPEGAHGVLVPADSPVQDCAGLADTDIAINTLKSMGDLHIMDAIDSGGGDSSTARFVELPFPQMLPALEQGQIDAMWTPEPFLTMAQDAGMRVACYDGVESVKGHPTMMFFTSADYVNNNGDTVAKMQTAINQAMDYATAHPDEVRTVATEKMNVDAAVAQKMRLEAFGGPVRTDVVQATGDLMVKYGFLTQPADVEGLLQSANG